MWGCGRRPRSSRKRARGCRGLQKENIHLISTCSQAVRQTCTFLKHLSLYSIVKGIGRACPCGTNIWFRKRKVIKKSPVSSSHKAKIDTAWSMFSLSLFLYHPEIQPNEKQSLPSRKTKQKPCVLNPHCVQTGTGSLPEQTSSRVKGFPLRALCIQSSSAWPRSSQPALTAQTAAKRPPITMTHLTALPRALGEVPKKEAVCFPEKSRHSAEEYLKRSF